MNTSRLGELLLRRKEEASADEDELRAYDETNHLMDRLSERLQEPDPYSESP